MKIKYIPVFVKDMENGIRFFNDKLGLKVADQIMLDNQTPYLPIQMNSADLYLGLVVDKDNMGFKTRIILNTTDCLKDYHQLKAAGICFNKQPEYLAIGLSAEFNDDYGNQYILLEERNYNQQ
ncbi:MAG: VOC family protein [Mucilaginibacter sp.]|uniref:VOC family protein n=1 Tax=Mucilaginibacter sp. TaxID=1882438 RepID=UPI00326371E2